MPEHSSTQQSYFVDHFSETVGLFRLHVEKRLVNAHFEPGAMHDRKLLLH